MASTPVAPAQATTADVRVWLQTTIAATAFGTFLTGVLGAGEAARQMNAAAPKGHQPTTRAEALQGHYRADQRLVSAFFRRGVPGGVRVGLVVSGFVGLEMAISHARGTIDWRNGLGAGFATGLLYSVVGRVGRQGGVQLFALSTVCGLLFGLAQDARIALDAARQAQAAPTANATQQPAEAVMDRIIQDLQANMDATPAPQAAVAVAAADAVAPPAAPKPQRTLV